MCDLVEPACKLCKIEKVLVSGVYFQFATATAHTAIDKIATPELTNIAAADDGAEINSSCSCWYPGWSSGSGSWGCGRCCEGGGQGV